MLYLLHAADHVATRRAGRNPPLRCLRTGHLGERGCLCETEIVPKERGLRAFFENQELKRESRSEPNPSHWLLLAVLYGVTALSTLWITVMAILSHGRHAGSSPWWLTAFSTVCFILAIGGSLRRMRRDRRRLGVPRQAS
jgi:hypothetical protein